jgi:SusD family.
MKTLKYTYLTLAFIFSAMIGVTSCTDDLNTIPLDESEMTPDVVYGSELGAYTQGLAKIYAGYALSGNSGGDGDQDISGVDGGSQASFLRGLWNLQELPTEAAHCCWSDAGISDFNNISWNSGNVFIKGLYYRLYYQIQLTNAFLRETTDDKLAGRGVPEDVKAQIKIYQAEARFSRALSYYYLLDLFRNVSFVDENSPIGKVEPPQIQSKELFDYIEKELFACESDMLTPVVGYNSTYGRANKAAAWALLSRLYLNANVYIGADKYTESITYSNKILEIGYSLEPNYIDMFKADNGYSSEMIFPIRYEGDDTQTWGGMTFLLCSGVPSDLQASVNSVGAWQGNRARSSLLQVFEAENGYAQDSRFSMLRLDKTNSITIDNTTLYTNNGIPIVKYYNVNKDGSLPPSNIAYTDFPLFRLGEIYLNYAEAVVRGGNGGSRSKALELVNELRTRAYNNKSLAPISDSALNLDFLLAERGRELLHEAQRRTDLIRFNKFTGSDYVWEWKGGVQEGRSVSDIYKIYPLPSDEIGSNSNLTQNPGY